MLAVCIGAAVNGCSGSDVAETPLSQEQLRTTNGKLALDNLDAVLIGARQKLEKQNGVDRLQHTVGVIRLLLVRAEYRGNTEDRSQAFALAETLATQFADQPQAMLVLAKVRSALHDFKGAAQVLENAPATASLGQQQQQLLLARGNLRALKATESPQGFQALAFSGQVLAEQGRWQQASKQFAKAQQAYHDVSPFALAWLYLTEGQMWMQAEEYGRAEVLFRAALERVPQYPTATGLLAEMLWQQGKKAEALTRLTSLADLQLDPDHAAQLAAMLMADGQRQKAEKYRELAARHYGALSKRFPYAYLDHEAEFWLAAGNEPAKAWPLALANWQQRNTNRARSLVLSAALAAQADGVSDPQLCALPAKLEQSGQRDGQVPFGSFSEELSQLVAACG